MRITYYNTTPLGFTFDDLQRICYHLQHAEKENKLTDKDMGTLLKARAMVLVHEEEENQCRESHGNPGRSDCQ
jgi:hypothetical protein